jgi:hypothetical protein
MLAEKTGFQSQEFLLESANKKHITNKLANDKVNKVRYNYSND